MPQLNYALSSKKYVNECDKQSYEMNNKKKQEQLKILQRFEMRCCHIYSLRSSSVIYLVNKIVNEKLSSNLTSFIDN